MKKGYATQTVIAAALLGAVCGAPAWAGSGPSSMEAMQRQMQELIEQNKQLTQRVGELEGKMAETDAKTAEQFKAMEKGDEKIDPQKISEFVNLSGAIEVEFATGDDFFGENFNSFDVAAVELGLDIKATDWASGHVLIKYEEDGDENDFFVDEATITLGDVEKFPLVLTAGKFYMPFGKFDTNMIQDPLTLEIGEINESGAALGVEMGGFVASLYGYKGMRETDFFDDSYTELGYGVMAGYSHKEGDIALTGGVSWTNNMADSDGAIADAFDDADLNSIDETVSGLGLHAGAAFGPISIIGEYVTALDQFSPLEVEFLGQGAEPSAWNTELAYTTELLEREVVFAIGMQQTDESVALGLPESRYIGSIGMEVLPNTNLTLEYYYDNDYDMEEGGTGDNANVFTAQLAYEF